MDLRRMYILSRFSTIFTKCRQLFMIHCLLVPTLCPFRKGIQSKREKNALEHIFPFQSRPLLTTETKILSTELPQMQIYLFSLKSQAIGQTQSRERSYNICQNCLFSSSTLYTQLYMIEKSWWTIFWDQNSVILAWKSAFAG